MHEIDVVIPKKLHQASHASGINRTLNAKDLRRKTSSSKQVSEPADSAFWTNRYNSMTAATQLVGESKDHHLCAAGLVRLEHHRDSKSWQRSHWMPCGIT